jgi:hypothetical protein
MRELGVGKIRKLLREVGRPSWKVEKIAEIMGNSRGSISTARAGPARSSQAVDESNTNNDVASSATPVHTAQLPLPVGLPPPVGAKEMEQPGAYP